MSSLSSDARNSLPTRRIFFSLPLPTRLSQFDKLLHELWRKKVSVSLRSDRWSICVDRALCSSSSSSSRNREERMEKNSLPVVKYHRWIIEKFAVQRNRSVQWEMRFLRTSIDIWWSEKFFFLIIQRLFIDRTALQKSSAGKMNIILIEQKSKWIEILLISSIRAIASKSAFSSCDKLIKKTLAGRKDFSRSLLQSSFEWSC